MSVQPLPAAKALDAYFLEARSKLLDVAGILDRIGRGSGSDGAADDARLDRIRQALEVLQDQSGGRAERIQQIFSREYDPSWERPSAECLTDLAEDHTMPADLLPSDAIPPLAKQIDSAATVQVLRHLRDAGLIQNGAAINLEITRILERLAELGLVDPGYAERANGKPFIWVSNANGERVLKYFESSEGQQACPRSRLKIRPLAHAGLASLADMDRLKVLVAAECLSSWDPVNWPREKVEKLNPAEPVYVLRVVPDLHVFLRVLDSGEIELTDIIPEETLRWFFEHSGAGSPAE